MTRSGSDQAPGTTGNRSRPNSGERSRRTTAERSRRDTGQPSHWTAAAVPDLDGRVAVITGANSGIGRQTASILAKRGATVVLACRDEKKAATAAGQIAASAGAEPARLPVVRLDLASLESIREAADEIRSRFGRIDVLINNAAVMRPPHQRSADGFELTFATNHLGHFALTGLLLDRLLATPGSRIVTVSSLGHRDGNMRWDDLQFDDGYQADDAYAQSKLANLLFTYELQARLGESGVQTIALAAHPGLARTSLWRWDPLHIRLLASPVLHPADVLARAELAEGSLAGAARRDRSGRPRRRVLRPRSGGASTPATRSWSLRAPPLTTSPPGGGCWRESERLSGVRYDLDRRPGLSVRPLSCPEPLPWGPCHARARAAAITTGTCGRR